MWILAIWLGMAFYAFVQLPKIGEKTPPSSKFFNKKSNDLKQLNNLKNNPNFAGMCIVLAPFIFLITILSQVLRVDKYE
jgi:hypothetical protein